eukprot:CAMPEP_0170456526 /NCGR_PEP_ID=MMETSP0123-20130129/4129_1 /TAXON_ID=182087 /ORGANISM="Favella ehrenbergii, Strain Fehren 1" /LENGTH=187 /DNA_ID=CAMNT_0010720029 /DNA_START=892 /DNA_END=1454 /DNA_ORIENTATION=-
MLSLNAAPGKTLALIKIIIEVQNVTLDEIKTWVEQRTLKDRFSALHLASFKGNMDAIETLMVYGADPLAINFFGLNMLHVAAQGDSAASLYYFRRLKLDINMQDKRGSTPLHWACYSHSEIALSYLLAWGPSLNTQDQDGYTPLHLAVKSVDQVESTRPVRFLLIKGAEKNIRDNQGQSPADLIEAG